MDEILSQLFYGRLAPYENCLPNTPEYQETEQTEKDLIDQLLKQLSPEQKGLYTQIEAASNKMVSMELEKSFSEGFRLGCKFMFSILGQ